MGVTDAPLLKSNIRLSFLSNLIFAEDHLHSLVSITRGKIFFVSRFSDFFCVCVEHILGGNTHILGCSATIKNAIVIFNSPGGVNFGEYWRNAFMRFVKSVRTYGMVYRAACMCKFDSKLMV